MGLRRLFQREAAHTVRVSPAPVRPEGQDDNPLSPERQGDLQAAWLELTEAAKGSKVTSFHASTRAGGPWMEDPAAVRAVAAALREFPVSDSQ